MNSSVELSVRALIKKAEEGGWKPKMSASTTRSSLHRIIRTREQAARFMRLLKAAQNSL